MAKQYVTQEAYDKMKDLVSAKNEYEYLTSVGATNEAEGYRNNAKPMYNFLLNYDKDIANNFSGMNSVQAKEYLDNFAVARDEKSILGDISLGKYGWANSKTDDDKNKFQANTAQFYDELAFVNPQLADIVKGWDYNQLNSYITTGKMPEIKTPEVPKEPEAPKEPEVPKRTMWDVANDIVGFKKGYEGSYDAGNPEYWREHNNAQDYYTELEGMGPEGEALASYLRGSNAANAEAYIAEHAPVKPMTGAEAGTKGFNLIGNSGNAILSNIDKMYFDGNFGKDVTDMFNMYGNTEGAQELAKGAAANGGNYDSFANYNRHNTNLAYMLAGQNAVQNMRRGYAEDATKFLDTWGNQLTGSASNIADYEYKDKALASDEKVAMAQDATNREQIASDERIAQMSADTQKAVAQIEADAESKGYSEETINTIISGVTDLILNGKSYAALQGFLDQYGIKLPEQPVTTTDTVVPSGLGGLTKGGFPGLIGETVTIKTNDTSKGTGNTNPVDTKPVDTKPVDTEDDDTSAPITDDKYKEISNESKNYMYATAEDLTKWLVTKGFDEDARTFVSDRSGPANVIQTLVDNGYTKEAYMYAAAEGFSLDQAKTYIK